MRDLHFWRCLQKRSLVIEELLPELQELARWPLLERMPYLGLLAPFLTHPRAEVRATLLTALGGAHGRPALQHLLTALNDPEPTVRQAGVEALRRSLKDFDEPRWLHALFHPEPSVRQAALADSSDLPTVLFYKLYLLADPECRALVESQLTRTTPTAAKLPMLFDYLQRGVLSGPLARQLCARVTWDGWKEYLAQHLPRSSDMTEAIRATLQADWPDNLSTGYFPDRLDHLFQLHWQAEPAAGASDQAHIDRFYDLVLQSSLTENEAFQQWIVFTLLGVAAGNKSWQPRAMEICAGFFPAVLTCPWVPREVRHDALAGLYRLRKRVQHRPVEEVRALVAADLCRHPSGRLDLWAVGGVLHLLAGNPYQQLLQWVPLARVVEAFQDDPEQGVVFLCLEDKSNRGRKFLIQELCLRAGPDRARLLAWLVQRVDAGGLDFLGSVDSRECCQVIEQLLRLCEHSARALSSNKIHYLGTVLGHKVAAGQIEPFLRLWLRRTAPEDLELGLAILGRLARVYEGRPLLHAIQTLEPDLLARLRLTAICCPGFPYERELELAQVLLRHPDEQVRSWAETHLGEHLARQQERIREEAASQTSPEPEDREVRMAERLLNHPDEEIRFWAQVCLRERDAQRARGASPQPPPHEPARLLRLGVCRHLRQLPEPTAPKLDWCLALLASHDLLAEVDEQLLRFAELPPEEASAFLDSLDQEMVKLWRGEEHLPLLGHAFLYRWENHLQGLARLLEEQWPGDLGAALRTANGLTSPLLRRRFWEALVRLVEWFCWHDKTRVTALWQLPVVEQLVAALRHNQGDLAAGLLLAWRQAEPQAPLLATAREHVVSLLPDLSEPIRQQLQPWIDARGLSPASAGSPAFEPRTTGQLLRQIPTATDLDFLADCAYRFKDVVTVESAQRLLELGEGPGTQRLAEVIGRMPPPHWLLPLTDTIADWPEGPALEQLRHLLKDDTASPETRFRVAVALYKRSRFPVFDDLLDMVTRSSTDNWLLESDFDFLARYPEGGGQAVLALRLALSSQTHAYTPAIQYLTSMAGGDVEVRQKLSEFLELGTERMRELRLRAARWLARNGERSRVLPLLLQAEPLAEPELPDLLEGEPGSLVSAVVSGVLLAGLGPAAEWMLLAYLKSKGVDFFAAQEGLSRLLAQADTLEVRQEARKLLRPGGLGRLRKLKRVAQTFAWGVTMARQLTGKLFTFEMIASEDLGYTRLRENKVYISPLPILREQLHGREVTRALILHELGHHMYHKGEAAEAIWEEAQREQLHPLLNLVSDEHLERNLRALDRSFGDQIKLLDSYAFQHNNREVVIEQLLDALQGRSFEVLVHTPLRLARKAGCVLVSNGRILLEMERAGVSFARFLRALRMGLGNRHGDPRVEQGLALFKGRFRKSTMPELLEIARKLREIFGDETQLLDQFSQDAALGGDPTELAEAAEGLTNEELQEAIQRELIVHKTPELSDAHSRGGQLLNLAPEEEFAKLTTIRPLQFDPQKYAPYAEKVSRPAQQLRRYLKELGLAHKLERFRIRGRSLDRTRLRSVILRGDPRMLQARKLELQTDLFLGVLLDCSGSMSDNDNIEKAKLFAALLAEATRGQHGIDLRLWGFTDQVIYDCGSSTRPAVHDLSPDHGNNDAAALWHAAEAAVRSRRRAKILVMISDGSPTGCSVHALQSLVYRLTRQRKILCAQVAVRQLEYICFPHYVLLESDNLFESVRRFGVIISRLVQKALQR